MQNSFYIGDWLVEPQLNRIVGKRQEQALEPRLMRLLVLLAETPHQLVSKDDILDTVWHGLSVTDESLSQAISKLRKLLDDNLESPIYIGTIRKKGYRLVADVTPADENKRGSQNIRHWMIACVAAIAVVIFYNWPQSRSPEMPANSSFLSSTPVSSAPGRERDPAISEDGSFLVYSKQLKEGKPQIFLHGISRGTADRQITSVDANFAPVVMPGSLSVVFLRQSDGGCTVILSSLIDGAERSLGSCQGNSYADTAVSPGGQFVAFSKKDISGDPNAIVLLDVESGNAVPTSKPPTGIWGDYDPVFSQDGKTLFFARSVSEAMQDIYRIDLTTGKETRLTHDGRNIMGLARADNKILFSSNRDGRYAIWSLDQNDTLIRLPISQTGIINPSADSTGNRVIFEVIERMTALRATTSEPEESAKSLFQFNAELLHPAANPTFTNMAFSSNRSGFFEIWSARTNGEELIRLTDFRSGFTAHPRYSPNGQHIAFDARPTSSAQIFVMDSDGRNITSVISLDQIDRYAPSWTPTGDGLLFAREMNGQLDLWQLDLESKAESQVTTTGATFGLMLPDGSLYHTRPNVAGVWRLKPGATEPQLVLGSVEFSDWGNWTTDGVHLRYFDRKNSVLKSFTIADGSSREIAPVEGYVPTADPAFGFGLADDDALFVIRQRLESDIEYIDTGPPQER